MNDRVPPNSLAAVANDAPSEASIVDRHWRTIPFEQWQVGDRAKVIYSISESAVLGFAGLSGDWNPLHVDAGFARRSGFPRPIAHGILVGGYLSGLIGNHFPGPGALWMKQSFNWRQPVLIGDTISIELTIRQISPATRIVVVDLEVVNQRQELVIDGEGVIRTVAPDDFENLTAV